MTSLLEQKERLLNLQRETEKNIKKINREICYENKIVEDLEQNILENIDNINSMLTYLRDNYKKIYKLEMGLLQVGDINIKLIEPRGGPNGYTRYVEKIEAE
jgi:hypothetical protein